MNRGRGAPTSHPRPFPSPKVVATAASPWRPEEPPMHISFPESCCQGSETEDASFTAPPRRGRRGNTRGGPKELPASIPRRGRRGNHFRASAEAIADLGNRAAVKRFSTAKASHGILLWWDCPRYNPKSIDIHRRCGRCDCRSLVAIVGQFVPKVD